MARYQPPHLRNRPTQRSDQTESKLEPPIIDTGPSKPNRSLVNTDRPPTSRRDWSTSSTPNHGPAARPHASGSITTSNSSGMRPSARSDLHSRPRASEVYGVDMEFIQSVSRSGGDGQEGDALKDWTLQDRYRQYIEERLDKHYQKYPGPRNEPPTAGSTDQLESLGSIVLLFRKLREGVIASNRIDQFAVEVFEASATLAIFAKNTAQVISSLSGLVPGLYQAVDRSDRKLSKTTNSNQANVEAISRGMTSIELSSKNPDNRAHFASLLLLFHLCHSDSISSYHSTYSALTQPTITSIRSPLSNLTTNQPLERTYHSTGQPLLHPSTPQLDLTDRIRHILSMENFDPVAYFELSKDLNLSGPQRAIISWAKSRIRERAWEVLKRAYIDINIEWAQKFLGFNAHPGGESHEGELEDWIRAKGAKIVDGRVKLR